MPPLFDIAIIGGGASGVLAAIQCLRQATTPLHIALFEPGPRLAEGVAYATDRPEHLLNVNSARMSALPDQPDDFLRWLCTQPGHVEAAQAALAHGYAPRRDYAAYLRERLAQAQDGRPARLQVLPWRISGLARDADGWVLAADDATTRARHVLLATGNAPRPLPAHGAARVPVQCLVEAWDHAAVAAIDPGERVCVVGTGLSMADALLTLAGNGHRGAVHLLSRHALLPLPHTPAHAVDGDFPLESLHTMPLRARLRALRQGVRNAAARGLPWQAVMERLRPHGQARVLCGHRSHRRRDPLQIPLAQSQQPAFAQDGLGQCVAAGQQYVERHRLAALQPFEQAEVGGRAATRRRAVQLINAQAAHDLRDRKSVV